MSTRNKKEHQDNAPIKNQENAIMHLIQHEMYSLLERGVSDSNIKVIPLSGIMNLIRNDEKVERVTKNFRQLIESGKTEEAKKCKLNQSCFAVSAILEGGTGAENCVGFTQKVLCDYDHLTMEEVERCRSILQSDEHCLCFYQSLGGHGCGFHIITPVMGVHDDKSHKIAWQQVNEYYDKLLGLKHDTTCSDLPRKSILAHDPKAFSNPQAVPIYIDYTSLVRDRKAGRPLKGVQHTVEEVGKHLHRYMKARNMEYTEGNRNCYIFNAACQLNRYGVPIDEALDFFYNEAHDLPESEIRQAVHSAYDRHPEQHGTMSPYSKEDRMEQKKKSIGIEDVEEFLKSLADFHRNITTMQYELKWKDETEWHPLTDADLNDIWRRVNKELGKYKKSEIRDIIESSFSVPYNIFIESLQNLNQWDGVTDHIGTIADMVHIRPEYEQYFAFQEAFKKWIVAIVASIVDPKAFNKKILNLVGKQNTFKTTFFRMLALKAWGDLGIRFKNSFRDFNKDERENMTKTPIYCLDEISHLTSSFLDELKSFTTQVSIDDRRVYAHYAESRPRIASFCATGNYVSFLTDPTGNNRFLTYEVESIDNPYTTPMNIEGMWAQAYKLYLDGFQYWFSQEEDALIDKQNKRYEVASAEENLITTYYMIPQPGEQYKLVNATNIIEHISGRYKGQLNERKVNQVMRNLGFQEKRSSRARGLFMVQEIPPADVPMRQQSSDWSHLPTTEAVEQTDNTQTLF